MKRLLIAALLVTSLPALADHDYDDRHSSRHDDDRDDRDDRDGDRNRIDHPVVLDQENLRGELDDLSRLLDDIAAEPSSKKRGRMVSKAREQLDEIRRDVREAQMVDHETWRNWHHASAGNDGYNNGNNNNGYNNNGYNNGYQQQQQQPPVVVQPPNQQHPPPPPVVVNVPPNQQQQQQQPGTPPPGQGTYQAPPVGTPMYAIGSPDLENLKVSLKREAFGRDRLRVLDGAARSNYFMVAQVQQLLPLFDFSNDRLAAVRLLRPRIMDMQNGYQLYASFEFANDKAALKQILGQ